MFHICFLESLYLRYLVIIPRTEINLSKIIRHACIDFVLKQRYEVNPDLPDNDWYGDPDSTPQFFHKMHWNRSYRWAWDFGFWSIVEDNIHITNESLMQLILKFKESLYKIAVINFSF